MGTSTPTLFCPVVPPCTPASLTVCRRRSPPLPSTPRRSRSSLHQRGSTPSGSEAPSWPPSPPSSPCGSPRRSTTSPVPPSSTGSASRLEQKVQAQRNQHLIEINNLPTLLLSAIVLIGMKYEL